MDRNFQRSLSLVLKYEGGWSDHPKDPGGATMKGITLATYRSLIDPKATKDDLRHISDAQVATIYRKNYWDVVKGDDLQDGLDFAVFDLAVNSGPSRAAKLLQAVCKVRQDGKIGPQTLAAAGKLMRATAINDLCDRRMAFLKSLKTWSTFGKGWTSRVSSVRSEALKMTVPAPAEPVPAPVAAPEPAKPQTPPVAGIKPERPERPETPATWFLASLVSILASLFGKKAP